MFQKQRFGNSITPLVLGKEAVLFLLWEEVLICPSLSILKANSWIKHSTIISNAYLTLGRIWNRVSFDPGYVWSTGFKKKKNKKKGKEGGPFWLVTWILCMPPPTLHNSRKWGHVLHIKYPEAKSFQVCSNGTPLLPPTIQPTYHIPF